MSNELPIIIPGAGPSGAMMASYLARRGYKVELYERRPDMRRVDISAGKSINLALSERGLSALRELGIGDDVMKMVIPMRGRMIHAVDGSMNFQPYSHDEKKAINSISRGGLNMKLLDLAESLGVKIIFGQRAIGMNMENKEVRFRDETSGNEYSVKAETVIGCDGAFSGVRDDLLRTSRVNFSQTYLEHGYKELEIPAGPNGSWKLEKNSLHIWPRGQFMMIALPNEDGSFTVTLFFPLDGDPSFASLNNDGVVNAFFKKTFADAIPLMPELADDFFRNPTGTLVTVRLDPWHHKGNLALVGDAAHAVVPFYGQGMNCAFEDCSVLDGIIDELEPDLDPDAWQKVFEKYSAMRVDNGHAIASMAIENYEEMRSKTADPDWLLRKKIEHGLEDRFPEKYISRYEMISFSRIPYSEAMRRGEINERILNVLAQGITSVDAVNWNEAEQLVNEWLINN